MDKEEKGASVAKLILGARSVKPLHGREAARGTRPVKNKNKTSPSAGGGDRRSLDSQHNNDEKNPYLKKMSGVYTGVCP